MGIDIGFTDESLKECKYAECSPYRKKMVGFYCEPPAGGEDELAQYRRQDVLVDMSRLRGEDPDLHNLVLDKVTRPYHSQLWPWNQAMFGTLYEDELLTLQLEPYFETKPTKLVLLDGMPEELGREWIEKVGQEHLLSAWSQLHIDSPLSRPLKVCRPCPIRPLDDVNCYLRFSNYPGMRSFREGLLLATLYSITIDEDDLGHALFSFPHVDRSKGETPADKVEELLEMCKDTEVKRSPEVFFNSVVDLLDQLMPDDAESDGAKLSLEAMPYADEFVSKLVYRDEPYSPEEARELLPYLETLKEVADWAIWETDSRLVRTRIISFKERLDSLNTALKLADKYGLEAYMSY